MLATRNMLSLHNSSSMDGYVKDLVDAGRIASDPHVIGYMLWAALQENLTAANVRRLN